MTPEEQQLLSSLADRIKSAPTQNHDPDADRLLTQMAHDRPDAVYLLAQTVLMQDFALRNAQAQIRDLQQQVAASRQAAPASGGSFLGNLFGGGHQAPPPPSPAPVNPWAQSAPPQAQPVYAPQQAGYAPVVMQPSQTGGFLRSAATTAAGVAGGALLFEGIESLFSGHSGMGYGGMGGGFVDPTGWGGGPRESLSETTIVNNNYYGDDTERGGDAGYAGDQGGYQDTADTGGDFLSDDSGGGDGGDYV